MAKGVLNGIGCGAGVVEGKERVILSPDNYHSINKGDILVTQAANPGWAPLFLLSSGVITENGGALSHGAIVAREYGIPMVTAVQGVTSRLKTGDKVKLNATQGTVELIQ